MLDRRLQEDAETRALVADERVLLGLLQHLRPARHGDRWRCLCPVHGEKTPSCYVKRMPDGVWRWRCFSCGASGDAIDLVVKFERVSFREARKKLGAREVMPLPAPPSMGGSGGKRRRYDDDHPPLHVLACERRGCDAREDVRLIDVLAGLSCGAFLCGRISRSAAGDVRWVCRACCQLLERAGRWWALHRLLNAPGRAG